jgi:hypothetical protein
MGAWRWVGAWRERGSAKVVRDTKGVVSLTWNWEGVRGQDQSTLGCSGWRRRLLPLQLPPRASSFGADGSEAADTSASNALTTLSNGDEADIKAGEGLGGTRSILVDSSVGL